MHHEVASLISQFWMGFCGIPKLLQGIVQEVCYKPRVIHFKALGVFKEVGNELTREVNTVTLNRGVLMGDPLTKPVLHILNILVREVPEIMSTGSIRCNTPATASDQYRSLRDQILAKIEGRAQGKLFHTTKIVKTRIS